MKNNKKENQGFGLKIKLILSGTDFAVLGKLCKCLSFVNCRVGRNISILLGPHVVIYKTLFDILCSPGKPGHWIPVALCIDIHQSPSDSRIICHLQVFLSS